MRGGVSRQQRFSIYNKCIWFRTIICGLLILFTNKNYSKATALSASAYVEICPLGERVVKLKYKDGALVKLDDSETEFDNTTSHETENDLNRTLQSRNFSSLDDQTNLYRNVQENQTEDDGSFINVRECTCAQYHNRPESFCLIRHNENHCQVPTDNKEKIECFHSSMMLVFIRNLWPISILWLIALTFYLISTENGRTTLKYVFKNLCCCFRDACSNSRLIENIITRETSMRDLYEIAQLTRAQEEDVDGRNASMVTYLLKTKEFFSGKKAGKNKNVEKDIELTNKQCCANDDIYESPSNDTLLTSPDSFASSPSFDDVSPLASDNDNDLYHQHAFSTPKQNNNVIEIFDEDDEDNLCTICMLDVEDGERVGVLPCDHLFHADCLKEWIKRRNVCPLCQTKLAEEKDDSNECRPVRRVRYPTTFVVRTTGSQIEPPRRRRPRVRRLRASNLEEGDTTRRQLFIVNGNGRIPPRLTSNAGVALIGARRSASNQSGQNQNRRTVLVGDASRASSSRIHRARNRIVEL